MPRQHASPHILSPSRIRTRRLPCQRVEWEREHEDNGELTGEEELESPGTRGTPAWSRLSSSPRPTGRSASRWLPMVVLVDTHVRRIESSGIQFHRSRPWTRPPTASACRSCVRRPSWWTGDIFRGTDPEALLETSLPKRWVSRHHASVFYDAGGGSSGDGLTQSFFKFRQSFLDFVACYSDSVIFYYSDTFIFRLRQPFLIFRHAYYSDSVIFAIVTRSFFRFR
jgi:hypothetical protein